MASTSARVRKAGAAGVVSLALGIFVSFIVGAGAAAFGYTDAVSMATIGGGAATYIVGPVTGTRSGPAPRSCPVGRRRTDEGGGGDDLHALRRAADRPEQPEVGDGLRRADGHDLGGRGGLAATDKRLVPYGAMTATFYTGLGCLLGPSVALLRPGRDLRLSSRNPPASRQRRRLSTCTQVGGRRRRAGGRGRSPLIPLTALGDLYERRVL